MLAGRAATRQPIAVLFVCLGNICRSPLAKGILQHRAAQRGLLTPPRLVIDSCGTGNWHVGHDADPRSHMIAQRRGVCFEHVARQVDVEVDGKRFDLILPMDERNRADLLDLGLPAERTILYRSFDPTCTHLPEHDPGHGPSHDMNVPDPYYGGPEGFQTVFDMLDAATTGLLQRLSLA